jgi:ABC-2 type transport system permease protein
MILRALPTLLRVGISEAIAYRAEMFVWVLSTTMPFVMWMMFSAVTEVAPIVGQSGKAYGTESLSAYFLAMFVVRQLVSCWASWEMNWEVRQGTLAMRLLRPMHPLWSYAASHLAAIPLRAFVCTPAAVALFTVTLDQLPSDFRYYGWCVVSLIGAWLVSFLANVSVGMLSFFMESSLKVMEVWLACMMVFSGYLIPLDFFPPWLQAAVQWMPFRYQLGLPVEILTGVHSLDVVPWMILRQWLWVGGLFLLATTSWRFGVKRFQAFGG